MNTIAECLKTRKKLHFQQFGFMSNWNACSVELSMKNITVEPTVIVLPFLDIFETAACSLTDLTRNEFYDNNGDVEHVCLSPTALGTLVSSFKHLS